ncbi:MAG: hypothetical protein COW76_16230 [Shewanella sp. CG18_big_fil_WC_8_21_14_2_50_42_11]|jgi:hypothetical protein|nr:MAG: hypothetical protein COW76_16230 [Shewanella sp. CG18_big_fil_WC_8_21_14_2_50_42_11]PIX70668.1 MAG: hypothetical protein COZ42_13620 [Shewanella sp. CG_4_10_14_3_um_filter_42_91]PIY66855.1 MAG: hypothetical protein COY92_08535 [Shewanella sp. CG_4_10_14_0_8_um_filter_42_13]PJB91000.1 MAG: hypothetical protein CO084_13755 [Shewanella sp. CG_4_9_14_0_8_um_filter_42_14]
MPEFIVNKNAQNNGDHEVHNKTTGCSYMPLLENQVSAGTHATCAGAVSEVKKANPSLRINGCYYCCNACHTS